MQAIFIAVGSFFVWLVVATFCTIIWVIVQKKHKLCPQCHSWDTIKYVRYREDGGEYTCLPDIAFRRCSVCGLNQYGQFSGTLDFLFGPEEGWFDRLPGDAIVYEKGEKPW